jgi:uncharacterized protein (TIGR00299 family) protein
MGKTLYLECSSGISGDMSVAALLDLGADPQVLKKTLDSLKVDGFKTKISRVQKSGLDACDFSVILDAAHENHDHDMEYLHGRALAQAAAPDATLHHHEHEHNTESAHDHTHEHDAELAHDHTHEHGAESAHNHTHEHTHDHSHTHAHEHRGMAEILAILDDADMTERARALARRIFEILAQAEARAHGVPESEVHFHEVGAVDSIVDVAAAAVCLDNLDIEEVIIPKLNEGTGFVRCQHGVIPVPVPAVLNIASANGLILHMTDVQGELVTPTGAAIAAAIKTSDQLPERFTIEKVGLGAGKRNYERPSILRAMLIHPESAENHDIICRLESNIDDCTGETLGYVMDRLLEAGARDVNYTPVYMKKNRPAYQLNVICTPKDREKLESIIFEETTTIGIRRVEMERTVLRREATSVETPYGKAQVKLCVLPDGRTRCYPEYQSAARIAREHNLPIQEVYDIIRSSWTAAEELERDR